MRRAALLCAAALALPSGGGLAQPPGADPRRSGFDFMSPSTQAMQKDDAANPAWLWLKDGEQRFAKDCARCHDAAAMNGVAARHPAVDAGSGRVLTLGARIAACHARNVGGAALAPESDGRLALETFVAHARAACRWRRRPVPGWTPRANAAARFHNQRFGQLDLACAQCHDAAAGRALAGTPIPQAHPTGYPIYRLEWQAVGSLERRLRGCMSGVRAEPFAYDSDELTALQAYLMQRAAGMWVESPGVRP